MAYLVAQWLECWCPSLVVRVQIIMSYFKGEKPSTAATLHYLWLNMYYTDPTHQDILNYIARIAKLVQEWRMVKPALKGQEQEENKGFSIITHVVVPTLWS